MPGVSPELRHASHDAWIAASGNKRKAIKAVKQHPECATVSRPGRLVDEWGKGFAKRRSYEDAPRSGRPRQLQPSDVQRAAEILKAGYAFNSMQRGYGSFQQAVHQSAELKQILQRSHVTSAHLLRCIKHAHPEVVFRKQPVKAAFNLIQKRSRVRACKRLRKRSNRWLDGMFWVDAKKMHIKATTRKAWLDSSEPTQTVPDSRTDGRVTLHFHAMVNAKAAL